MRAKHVVFLLAALGTLAFVLVRPPAPLAATTPSLVGSTSNSTSLSGVTAVAVAGNYAYSTAYYAGTLTAVDISDKAHPTVAGQSASTNNLKGGSTVNIVGGYAYVASKNRNGPNGSNSNDDGSGNSFTILDIATNPAQPTVVGSVRDPINLFGAYGVAVSGNYAYVAAQAACPASRARIRTWATRSPSSTSRIRRIRRSSQASATRISPHRGPEQAR